MSFINGSENVGIRNPLCRNEDLSFAQQQPVTALTEIPQFCSAGSRDRRYT